MTLPGPRSFTASLTSASFDAVLLMGDALSLMALNDDSGDASGGTDSFFRMIATGGVYLIEAQLFVGGTLVESDDNSGGGTNARLTYQAPLGQNRFVHIVPSTKGTGVTGAYTLTIALPTATMEPAVRTPALRTERLSDAFGTRKSRVAPLRWWHRFASKL